MSEEKAELIYLSKTLELQQIVWAEIEVHADKLGLTRDQFIELMHNSRTEAQAQADMYRDQLDRIADCLSRREEVIDVLRKKLEWCVENLPLEEKMIFNDLKEKEL